jgi:hypothetical protein
MKNLLQNTTAIIFLVNSGVVGDSIAMTTDLFQKPREGSTFHHLQ